MTPVLVEETVVSSYSFEEPKIEEPKPEEPFVIDNSQHYLQLVEEQVAEEHSFSYQEEQQDDIHEEMPEIQLIIKNEEPLSQPVMETMREPVKEPEREPVVMKIGSRVLTEDEIEEKRRFEEQKKALEDRAERLRRMSFNIKGNESVDDIENVPAYMRKNMKLDNGVSSSDTFYSGYTVGHNDEQNNPQATIQTINTFLDGKKPD